MTYLIDGNYCTHAMWNTTETEDEYEVATKGISVYSAEDVKITEYYPDQTVQWGQIFTSGINIRPKRPDEYYSWSNNDPEGSGTWVVNQVLFTPILFADISVFRDEQLFEVEIVEVEYDEELLGLRPDERTIAAVDQYAGLAPIRDNDDLTQYKFASVDGGTSDYRDVPSGFFQDALDALLLRRQQFFDAEAYVRSTHLVTPYTTKTAARADMLDFVAGVLP